MKKRLLLVATFVAMMSVGVYGVNRSAPVAQAAEIGLQHSSGPTAMASFSHPLGDNITQFVSVFASTGRLQTGPGKPMNVSGVDISIIEINEQTQTLYFVAMGHQDVPGLVIDGKQLTGATLPLTTFTMEVMDFSTGDPTGQFFPLQVAISWTGTGDITSSRFVSHFTIPGGMEITRGSGKSREALALASTLTATPPGGAAVNFSGRNADLAGLSNNRFMDIVIMH